MAPSCVDLDLELRDVPGLAVRAGVAGDMEFLFDLLKVAMGTYVTQTYGAWNDAEQRERFRTSTRPEVQHVLLLHGNPIGCLFVQRTPRAYKLNRIHLLPEHQRHGIGTTVVQAVVRSAAAEGLPVTLRVMKVNPAKRLYERLGFDVTGETETHFLMSSG